MKDHTGRAATEAGELYAVARGFAELRTEITVPRTPSDVPDLFTASQQLATLGDLIKDLSDEALYRAADDDPGLDLGPVIYAYAAAAAPAGRAMEDYTQAYVQFGFLRRFADAPESGDLRDGREAAFRVVREQMMYVRDGLLEAISALQGSADRLYGTPPPVLAALSRSARPANSIYHLPAKPDAPEPTPGRHASTPTPRRAR